MLLIIISHSKDQSIDLAIYRDTGQLVVNGINPYDFTDNVELRQKLRSDEDNYNEYVSSDQTIWDYYANSNLPLASLFFGCIEYLFGTPRSFRYTFAFFDSILAVLILAFVLNKWKFHIIDNKLFRKLPPEYQTRFPVLIGLLLGAFSPVLLQWGTFIPEPKGIGLLLMLASVYFSDSSNNKLNLMLSPVLLGFSVAFIGLGVFLSPLCLYNIYEKKKNGFKKLIIYTLVSLASCLACFIPFLPELISMMLNRLREAATIEPYHGSIWALLFKIFPGGWLLIKNSFVVFFVGINIIGFLRKRLNVIILSANLLYLFTIILLMNGSMDRMNISIVSLILLLGYSQVFNNTNILWLFYFMYGSFSFLYSYLFAVRQDFDGIFVLLFTLLYFGLLSVQIFTKKTALYETVSSHTRLQ
jgi:hypothetical protein